MKKMYDVRHAASIEKGAAGGAGAAVGAGEEQCAKGAQI
jgi:hypothetical protein